MITESKRDEIEEMFKSGDEIDKEIAIYKMKIDILSGWADMEVNLSREIDIFSVMALCTKKMAQERIDAYSDTIISLKRIKERD